MTKIGSVRARMKIWGKKEFVLILIFFLFLLSYKDKHKASRLRSYQYVNGEEGRYHKQYGDFFSPNWHEFRVLVHKSIEIEFFLCMSHLLSLTIFNIPHTPQPKCMYIYQFSFWRGVNWSHIKYPNWASGAFLFSFCFFFFFVKSVIYCFTYIQILCIKCKYNSVVVPMIKL